MTPRSGRLIFTIGDAFPSNPTVSVFIAAISVALNDLIMVSKLLLRSEAEDGPAPERLYLLRWSFGQRRSKTGAVVT